MDGDIAPLHGLAALAHRHDTWLMSDDAHGLGVVGGGRGSNFVQAVPADVPLQMGTLSKALGSYGGYVCASAAVVELIRNRAYRGLFDRTSAGYGRGRSLRLTWSSTSPAMPPAPGKGEGVCP